MHLILETSLFHRFQDLLERGFDQPIALPAGFDECLLVLHEQRAAGVFDAWHQNAIDRLANQIIRYAIKPAAHQPQLNTVEPVVIFFLRVFDNIHEEIELGQSEHANLILFFRAVRAIVAWLNTGLCYTSDPPPLDVSLCLVAATSLFHSWHPGTNAAHALGSAAQWLRANPERVWPGLDTPINLGPALKQAEEHPLAHHVTSSARAMASFSLPSYLDMLHIARAFHPALHDQLRSTG